MSEGEWRRRGGGEKTEKEETMEGRGQSARGDRGSKESKRMSEERGE